MCCILHFMNPIETFNHLRNVSFDDKSDCCDYFAYASAITVFALSILSALATIAVVGLAVAVLVSGFAVNAAIIAALSPLFALGYVGFSIFTNRLATLSNGGDWAEIGKTLSRHNHRS